MWRNKVDRLPVSKCPPGKIAPYLRDRPGPKQLMPTPEDPINAHKQANGADHPKALESFK